MGIADHLQRVFAAGGEATAVDFDGAVLSWSALANGASGLEQLLAGMGIGRDSPIGLLGRNRLDALSGFVDILATGRGMVLVNALRPAALVAEEIEELKLACVLGGRADLSPEVVRAAERAGSMLVAVDAAAGRIGFEVVRAPGNGLFRERAAGTLIEIQTSGTTGKPKRIAVAERTFEASLRDGVRSAKGAVDQAELKPKMSPTLMFSPLVHTSGTFNTLMALFEVRPIVLFEKFDAAKYRQALCRYRPKFVPLPPSAIKMMVDSSATREDFASVAAVRAGTAPLPLDLHRAFEEKFGVPILTTYGATEFMGVVTSWTLDDYRQFGEAKQGSVGRVSKGVEVRVVDPATGTPLRSGDQGILEARLDRIDGGRDWIRTTDLAVIDEDGFVFIQGRVDDAIIRGGFKVMAGKVADLLRQYPGVCEVVVLGRPDDRLGEVPVAVVEPDIGGSVDAEAVRAFAKARLTPYEVPARVHVVDRLPRTISDKVSRPEVHKLLDGLAG